MWPRIGSLATRIELYDCVAGRRRSQSINDTRGHLVGDEVLKEIARRLLLSIRSYDFVSRYGGEEFLLVLNNCNPQSVEARAEELRKVANSRPIQTAIFTVQVSMSLGVLLSSDWGAAGRGIAL